MSLPSRTEQAYVRDDGREAMAGPDPRGEGGVTPSAGGRVHVAESHSFSKSPAGANFSNRNPYTPYAALALDTCYGANPHQKPV